MIELNSELAVIVTADSNEEKILRILNINIKLNRKIFNMENKNYKLNIKSCLIVNRCTYKIYRYTF